MRTRTPSIRRNLLVGTILVVSLAILTGSAVIYLAQKKVLTAQLDERLIATAELLTIEVEFEQGKPYQEWLVHILDNDIRKEKDLIQVWEIQSGESFKSPALGEFDLPKFHDELNIFTFQDVNLPGGKTGRALGVKILPSFDENEPVDPAVLKGLEHIFVLALETKQLDHAMTELHQTLLWVVTVTILVTALSIFWTIRKSLIPIHDLAHRLQQREIQSLGNPIEISGKFPKELKGLVEQYDHLLERIQAARIRERDFSAHAAHELRTPLAGIQSTLEQAINGKYDPHEYELRIQKTLTISKEMARLVTHLMRFSKLQSHTQTIVIEEINFHELIEATVLGYSEKATTRGLQLDLDLASSNFIQKSDEDLTRILISNFCDNAISYAEKNSTILVRTFDTDRSFTFSTSNRSASPLPKNIDRLFEPFYRADQARNADDCHTGIGLSLCREIANTLHAEITISTPSEHEFEVLVTFE